MTDRDASSSFLTIVAPAISTKNIKLALERDGLLHETVKIFAVDNASKCIPTCIAVPSGSITAGDGSGLSILEALHLLTEQRTCLREILLKYPQARLHVHTFDIDRATNSSDSPIVKSLTSCGVVPSNLDTLTLPRYEHYSNFVLFKANAFSSADWLEVLNNHPDFFSCLAKCFNVGHIAEKITIPREDVMRRPKIKALYGEFGIDSTTPEEEDVFWAQAKITMSNSQGNRTEIHYTWAPQFTMYSRGNHSEKERIAALSDVKGKTVVDLYAGIGYFVFPYLHAGAAQVFACEINPFSVSGLLRAAPLNHVSATKLCEPSSKNEVKQQLVVLPYPNADCLSVFRNKAEHVNMGLLPDARAGLPTAIQALVPAGGVIRLHEEVAFEGRDRSAQRQEWSETVRQLVQTGLADGRQDWEFATVFLEQITLVKSLSPTSEHLIADLRIQTQSSSPA